MPDSADDYDLDYVLTSVVIEPNEQFHQRLKVRLLKLLNDPTLQSRDSRRPLSQVNPTIQENNPMNKSRMPAFVPLIKSLFVHSADAPSTPRRTWAFSAMAIMAMAAVVAIMAFVLGGGGQQVIVGSGVSQDETSEPTQPPTIEATATSEPTHTPTIEATATSEPTHTPTVEARPTREAMSIEEASTLAGFTVLELATALDGYNLDGRNAESGWAMTVYSLPDDGRSLWFTQTAPVTTCAAWLANELLPERVIDATVNGSPALFLPQDDGASGGSIYNQLCWTQGNFTFVMGALHFTQEEMIDLAESLQ